MGLLLQIEKSYFVEFKYLYKPEPLNLIAKYLSGNPLEFNLLLLE